MTPITDCKFPGIYRFANLVNGKIYVGQAVNIYHRYYAHRQGRGTARFARAVRKYGIDSFVLDVLERVSDLSTLNSREQWWIDQLNACNKSVGYNIAPFASTTRGVPCTDETKRKISAAHKGKALSALHRAAVGRPMKPEKREQMSLLSVLKTQKSVNQIDPKTGETIAVWESTRLAAKGLGFSAASIGEACRGYYFESKSKEYISKNTYKGFVWEYAAGANTHTPRTVEQHRPPVGTRKRIVQVDLLTGTILKTWDSIQDASTELSLSLNGIASACKGRYWSSKKGRFYEKTAHAGFKWQYAE